VLSEVEVLSMTKFPHNIFRTGLAVMLAGLFFLVAIPARVTLAEEPKPESDSAILARHIREAKIGGSIEEFSEHSFNSHLSDTQLDSILAEDNMRITGGKVYYSPDSTFKVFVVEGEHCGAYCNPDYYSWLHFNDGSGMIINEADIAGSYVEIALLPDHRYLVIESYSARPAGYYTIVGHTARVISFDNHKMITHPAFVSMDIDSDSTYYGQSQEFVIDSAEYLDYDASARQLRYQYGHDPAILNEGGSAYVRKGYFQLEEGKFVEKEHTITRYKVRNE
jgi:hypothetical protein